MKSEIIASICGISLVTFVLFVGSYESGSKKDTITAWTDKTGCEYLVFKSTSVGGITPRLDNMGLPKCKDLQP